MSARKKVLVVEDSADIRRLYAIGLNHRGYEVKLAANGAEALDRIETEKPDVILLDLLMPIMDGWEVMERLNPPGSGLCIPVVVISGQVLPPEHITHDRVAGWLVKPISIEQLVEAITVAIPLGRAKRRAARTAEQLRNPGRM
jgi:two-component system OmpR family response regulator